MAEFVVYMDVEEPVLNVYCERHERALEVGAVVDFGVPQGNSMRGAWRVLSHERMPSHGQPPLLRVNIIREERYASD